ncbi:hypothetical protein KJ780_02125 [Candidatus Micrarchaeota archaeon]|nr:hypothetical protein [Candidatus Micrarchaeota archaeon]
MPLNMSSSLKIFLNKSSYNAGEELEATIQFNTDKPINARGIFAELTCTEKKKQKYTRAIPRAEVEERKKLGLYTEVPYTYEERIDTNRISFQEKKVADSGEFSNSEYKVKFTLPRNAQPTSHDFGHDNKQVKWNLHVKLDVPFAFDVKADHEVFVSGL